MIVGHSRQFGFSDLVQLGMVGVAQLHVDGADIVHQVLHRARTDDGTGNAGFADNPCQRDLAGTAAFFLS